MIFFFFFCLLGFLSWPFTNHRTAEEREGNFFNSTLTLPPASQALDISCTITAESSPLHIAPGGYCRELTSAHSSQLDLNWATVVAKGTSLTTKLHALRTLMQFPWMIKKGATINGLITRKPWGLFKNSFVLPLKFPRVLGGNNFCEISRSSIFPEFPTYQEVLVGSFSDGMPSNSLFHFWNCPVQCHIL